MSKLRKAAIFLLLLGFIFFGYKFLSVQQKMRQERNTFYELQQTAQTAAEEKAASETEVKPEVTQKPEEKGDPEPQILPQYAELAQLNEEFFGWVKLPGCGIDYPVMYTPDDPEKYLHRDFYGEESFAGVPFLDANCTADGGVYLLYGHNMANGTMFGQLDEYYREEFLKANPEVQFDTRYTTNTYRIFAAARIVLGISDDQFEYFAYTDLRNEKVFKDFVTRAKENSFYDTGLTPRWGDEILMLSTCAIADNERTVIFAYREK